MYVFVPWMHITDNIIFYRELGFGDDQLLTWVKKRPTLPCATRLGRFLPSRWGKHSPSA